MIFDKEAVGFKKLTIVHEYHINSIEIPEELKNEKDFAKVKSRSGTAVTRIGI